jgi:hypothetical protein
VSHQPLYNLRCSTRSDCILAVIRNSLISRQHRVTQTQKTSHPLSFYHPTIITMADSGTGIQELMAAETRASQIVAEARIGEFNQGEEEYERL